MSKRDKNIDMEAEVLKKAASKYADTILEKVKPTLAARDLEAIEDEKSSERAPTNIYDVSKFEKLLEDMKNKMPEPNSFAKMSKQVNYLGSFTMVAAAIFRFASLNTTNFFVDWFYSTFSIYLILFGVLLFAAEWKYAAMIKYFEFLVTDLGKATFMIFIGVLLFDNQKTADLCGSLTLSILGLVNLIIYCSGRK